MPRKTRTNSGADNAAQPQLSAEALEQLMLGPVTPAKSENFFRQFKKAVSERALGAEMNHHLGYARREAKPVGAPANYRNGKGVRTLARCT